MRRIPLVVLISAIFTASAFAGGPEHDAGHHGDVSKVNRSISIEQGGRAGDVETVNGSITIGDDAIVESAETVNGSVRIGANGQAQSLETVNGSISVGAKTVVSDGIETVNGAITLADDAASLDRIETVNGRIELGARAQAGAGIELVNGDVELKNAARVTGNIVVRKPNSFGWFNSNNKPPKVILGPNAVVSGDLVFEREVELYMHTTAKITGKQHGPLVGGKVVSFSGDRPNI
jgi:DUF4097 and DUF4098 domain-containing protein YvlB